jgi:ketosteroid isomerase-like protein
MPDQATRQCVIDFLDGYYDGDASRVMACCAEDFESIVYAPVELFPHLGHQRGRQWGVEATRILRARYASRRYELTFMAVEGEKASTMVRVSLKKRNDHRIMQLQIADFFTLRDGLILSHRAFFDSFDLVQQVLGRDLTEAFAASVRHAMPA